MKNQLDPLDPLAHAKDTLLDLAVRFGPKLLVAIFIITVGVFAAGWVARAIDRLGKRVGRDGQTLRQHQPGSRNRRRRYRRMTRSSLAAPIGASIFVSSCESSAPVMPAAKLSPMPRS